MRRLFAASIAAAVVVVACTHDFSAFESAPDAADAFVEPDAEIDAGAIPDILDAGDNDARDDDVPDATVDAGCDAGCVNTEKTCRAACNKTATDCQNKCRRGDWTCYFGCSGALNTCRNDCTSKCRSCSQNLCSSRTCSQ